MTNPDDSYYERVAGRIFKVMLVLAAGGAMVALVWRGWAAGAGFALGAAVSWLNFRWLKHVVDGLGSKRARPRLALLAGFRYLLLGGGAYVILRYSSISLPATLVGLFVSVAAIIVETVFEVIYARD
jgi:hypothetical protein